MTTPPVVNSYAVGVGTSNNRVSVPVIQNREPTSYDNRYPQGQSWIDELNNIEYVLTSFSSSGGIVLANWETSGGATGLLSTLTGDSGGAISPSSGNITLAGGTNITSSGSGSTITFDLDAAITLATSVTSPIYTAAAGLAINAAAANDITMKMGDAAGSNKISFTSSTPAEVASLTSTGAFTALSYATSLAATNLTISGQTIATGGSDANVNLLLTTKAAGLVVWSQSKAGVDMNMQITNSDNTAAPGSAGIQLAVGGSTSTGDPYVSFQVSGVGASTMSMGLDNSDSDKFVISNSTALGTSNALTLTQAGALEATTSITAGTSITATAGAITATNGNLVLVAEGNKMMRTSVASTTTAGANSIGTVTLAGGTATVSTTNVTASSLIQLTRQSIGATGAAALGELSVGTIVASTSFVINALQQADATALQASDVSVIMWEIIN